MPYIGRFAPSPTGPLHAGSLVAALASWLDARAQGGQWLVRLEDVDTPRCVPGADHLILGQLAACGLHPDATPLWQSQRTAWYQRALAHVIHHGLAYPCACSRKDIALALQGSGMVKPRHGELIYPGTCRTGLHGKAGSAWRLRTDVYASNMPLALMEPARAATYLVAKNNPLTHWTDRRLGPQQQDVATEVGDFVLQRADACYAYQLAVVVDDAAQHISHVVRGEDLADNTARQIVLQQALGLPTPVYLHTPLVRAPDGEKLSKQNGAQALDTSTPDAVAQALAQAAGHLNLPAGTLATWVAHWQARYGLR